MARLRLAPEARRALIFRAGEAELADRGFAGMRLEDVATRAGVTRAVVYDHFPSRTALAIAILDAAMDDLLAEVGSAVAAAAQASDDRAELLRAGFDAFFGFVHSRPAARRLLFRDPGADAELAERYRRQQDRADTAIAALLAPYLHSCPPRTVRLVAIQVKHALNGLAAWWWEHPRTARRVVLDSALQLLEPGLLDLAE